MGSFGSKSLAVGTGEFVDKTGGLRLITRGETILLNHLVELQDEKSDNYYGISSVPRKAKSEPLEIKSQAYVLRLRNPDSNTPQIIYQGDRGILQLTIYQNSYLDTPIGYYGVMLPPVCANTSTSFDGQRRVLSFGKMVEPLKKEEAAESPLPYRIASLDNVRNGSENIFFAHMFSIHIFTSHDNTPTNNEDVKIQSINEAYQQLTFTTEMDCKNLWKTPPLTLTLYRFKSQFQEDPEEKIPITKKDSLSKLGTDWKYTSRIRLLDKDDSDTVTLSGSAVFVRQNNGYYTLPFHDTITLTE